VSDVHLGDGGWHVGLDQCSYSTSGPVNTWMRDCLRAGKPSPHAASITSRLSLLPSVGR